MSYQQSLCDVHIKNDGQKYKFHEPKNMQILTVFLKYLKN